MLNASKHMPDTAGVRRTLDIALSHLPSRRFAVRLWDGTEVSWQPERDFTLVFRDASTFESLLGSLDPSAFAAAYVDGRLDIEGDVDAATGLATWLRVSHPSAPAPDPEPLGAQARQSDVRNIHAHYDLSEAFFRLFLDARLVYSCAYFARPDQNLEAAQERKLELICRKLDLHPGETFLDVGCGWGALVLWAARRWGVKATGITISRQQAATARALAAARGLSDLVTIQERHYEDLPAASFDKIASVGMIEHVGVAHYETYFRVLERALRPGGLLLNHGITSPPVQFERSGAEFLFHHVFPGAQIDSLAHTLGVMESVGLETLDVQSLRPHYALTLAEWNRRYRAQRDDASRLVPERVLRAWDLYLPGCRRAFEDGILSIHQCLAAKSAPGGAWPARLTREELLLRP